MAQPTQQQTLSVTELVRRLHQVVNTQVGLQWVEGEISNLRVPKSGHMYFTLKDPTANIACALYKFRLPQCQIKPENGIKVRLLGEASVFQAYGELQLLVQQIVPAGRGELNEKFEQLKRKLEAEGLFDQQYKKPIPTFPKSIGIITAATGAVIEDIRHTLNRRAPWIKAYLLPVGVQGIGNEVNIARAIDDWSNATNSGLPPVDLLIVGRGGGSLEDLWNFNEEIVARSIFNCTIPVISAVGHERDFTIADFVADLRAPTPTAAAELASPDGPALLDRLDAIQESFINKLNYKAHNNRRLLNSFTMSRISNTKLLVAPYYQRLDYLEDRFYRSLSSLLLAKSQTITKLEHSLQKRHPSQLNHQRIQQLEQIRQRLFLSLERRMGQWDSRLHIMEAQLSAVNPKNTLQRGFSILQTTKGHLIRSVKQIPSDENFKILLSDGEAQAVCTKKSVFDQGEQ